MAAAEQQLSPEEKLLKVIQGSGEPAKELSPEEKLLAAVKPPSSPPLPPKIQPPATARLARVEPPKAEPPKVAVPAPKPVEKPVPPVAKPAPAPAIVQPAAAKAPAAVVTPKPAPVAVPTPKPAAAEAKPRAVVTKPVDPKKAPEVKPPAPAADEKAKLKVLKSEPVAQEKEAPAKPVIAAGPANLGGPVDPGSAGRPGRKLTMGVVNRGLAAAVLLILAFTAYEIWAGAKSQRSSAFAKAPADGEVRGQETVTAPAELPALASYVDPWKTKDIFYQPAAAQVAGGSGTVQPPAQNTDVNGRLKIMGFSKQPGKDPKVILRDTKGDRMFVAGIGEKILVGERMLELVQVQNDKVVLSDGRDSITVSVK